MRITLLALAMLLAMTIPAWSAETHAAPAGGAPAHTAAPDLPYPHPALPAERATWAGVMMIIIGGLFLAAASIGPIVRANAPEEVPDAHSHVEPPGAHAAGHDAAPGHGHH